MICCPLLLRAQHVAVTGKVTDTSGAPVVGATVYQDGKTSNGTATDAKGVYRISVPGNATLVFSYLGYRTESVKVAGKTKVDVALEEDKLTLDAVEVVSVGYGSVARRDLTGSVSKVEMDELLKTTNSNFDRAIAGKIAGVVVTSPDGQIGAEANITIRGNNSLTQSNAPLYVIDGFPTESSMAVALNPADIESIDVLKDASATAIYGARGANGVIVITTKQGVEGRAKINFSANWTASKILNKPEMMDAYEFAGYMFDYLDVLGSTSNPYSRNPDDPSHPYTVEDYARVKGVDWQDNVYRTALMQQYNVSISGGSKTAGNRYNVSLSALDQDGIIVNSNFQRYQGKVNFSQNIGKKIRIDLNVNYSRSVTNGMNPTSPSSQQTASSWFIYSLLGYRPIKPLYLMKDGGSMLDEYMDENLDDSSDYRFNPAKTVRNEYRKNMLDYLAANGAFNYEIIRGLKLKISGGYTINNRKREEFNGSQTATGYSGSRAGKGINGGVYYTNTTSWLNENTLTWDKHVRNAHHLQLLGGFTLQGQNQSYQGVASNNMTTESLGVNGLHTGDYQTVTPYEYDWILMSALFRVNYNYKYKYYLIASFRADGSSKFPVNNRWGYFPSVGLSWNFNRENWFKGASWLSTGKLRASWGMTGNNRTTTPYDFYSQITTLPGSTSSMDYVFGGQIVPGYYPSNMSNDQLKWETTEQYNVGLDFGVFDNRLKLTADVYLKNTRDLLLSATIPATSGYQTAMLNVGSMRNKGLELTLDAVPVRTRNFSWSVNFNIAFNRNTVTALNDNQYSLFSKINWNMDYNSQYPYITQVGKSTGLIYGYLYEGTYKAEEFNNGTSLKAGIPYLKSISRESLRPGDPKYSDINGDGVIDDNDRTVIGRGQPIHTGGFSNTFDFYGFDLNIFFQWSYGNDVLNANRYVFEAGRKGDLNQYRSYLNHYDAERNPNSDIPRIYAKGVYEYSGRVVEDGSYLRLKNITLGYTLPKKVLRKMHFDTMRIYLSLDNVCTWTNYSGVDPEVSTRNSVLTPGFDWSAYPRAFSVTGGISFTF